MASIPHCAAGQWCRIHGSDSTSSRLDRSPPPGRSPLLRPWPRSAVSGRPLGVFPARHHGDAQRHDAAIVAGTAGHAVAVGVDHGGRPGADGGALLRCKRGTKAPVETVLRLERDNVASHRLRILGGIGHVGGAQAQVATLDRPGMKRQARARSEIEQAGRIARVIRAQRAAVEALAGHAEGKFRLVGNARDLRQCAIGPDVLGRDDDHVAQREVTPWIAIDLDAGAADVVLDHAHGRRAARGAACIERQAVRTRAARLDHGGGQRPDRGAATRGRRQLVALAVGEHRVAAGDQRVVQAEAGLFGVAADLEHCQHAVLHRVGAAQCGVLIALAVGHDPGSKQHCQQANDDADHQFDERKATGVENGRGRGQSPCGRGAHGFDAVR
jgi:hypothetical protein